MKLKEREVIGLIRYRTKQSQKVFYEGLCDQQAGSWIETHFERGVNPDYDKIVDLILKHSTLKNLTIGEVARILRIRHGDTIRQAAKKIGMSHVWVIAAERGKYFAEKLIRIYKM